jgi:hypothetical protein
VKCSLLTLSTFIDGELPDQRRSEVDAHLVGCPRCSAGAATLREEKARVGQLARVHVDPASAQSMLEQVGIAIDSIAPSIAIPAPPQPSPPSEQLPWQGGRRSSALPWTPRRPEPSPPATEELPVPSASAADIQPDLPLDGVRTAHPSRQTAEAGEVPEAAPEMTVTGAPLSPTREALATGPADPERDAWLDAPAPVGAWEADLPPPVETSSESEAPWDVQHSPMGPSPQPVPPPVKQSEPPLPMSVGLSQPPVAPPPAPDIPLMAAAPTRLAAASGPGALWTRVRDAIAVRMALSHGADVAEDSLQIVSGAPARPATKPTGPPMAPSADAIASAADAPPAPSVAAPVGQEVELSGFARPLSTPVSARTSASTDQQAAVADRRPTSWPGGGDDRDRTAPADPSGWNAFAASSYPLEKDDASVPRVAPRPMGRHGRAVAREQVPAPVRMWRAMARMAGGLRAQTTAATAAARRSVSGMSKGGPNSRLLAAVAGAGLLFVGVLLIGHSAARRAAPTATRPAPSAAVTPSHQSAPAQSSAAPQSDAPSATAVQTFGSGAGGFQVIRLRYGVQVSSMRVVFDVGAASGQAAGSPKVAVSFTDPKTMLVTFTGAQGAGSWRAPPTGTVISSVTLLSSGSQRSVYRFDLTHAVTTTGFFLAAPTRFILDLH